MVLFPHEDAENSAVVGVSHVLVQETFQPQINEVSEHMVSQGRDDSEVRLSLLMLLGGCGGSDGLQ